MLVRSEHGVDAEWHTSRDEVFAVADRGAAGPKIGGDLKPPDLEARRAPGDLDALVGQGIPQRPAERLAECALGPLHLLCNRGQQRRDRIIRHLCCLQRVVGMAEPDHVDDIRSQRRERLPEGGEHSRERFDLATQVGQQGVDRVVFKAQGVERLLRPAQPGAIKAWTLAGILAQGPSRLAERAGHAPERGQQAVCRPLSLAVRVTQVLQCSDQRVVGHDYPCTVGALSMRGVKRQYNIEPEC